MLNKNQSNKKNSWKYAFVLPLLVAFVFLFQVKVVAQEKESIETEKEVVKYTILNTTSNKELRKYSKKVKSEKGIDLKFEKIKRDKQNRIKEISIYTDNKIGKTERKIVKGNKPIEEIIITLTEDEAGKETIQLVSKKNTDELTEYWTVDNAKGLKGNYLIVINGKVQDQNNKIKMKWEEEIISEKTLKPKEALQKYGDAAKNGAKEITTMVKKGNEP